MFRDLGIPYSVLFDKFDLWLPRVHLEVDFHYPPRLDDRLQVSAYFTRFGNSSVRLNFDVWHIALNRMAATGNEVLVCTDRTTLKSKPLPEELISLLHRYLMTEEKARTHFV